MKNYYKILEVSENASKEVIDKAYRVLVKKYHPDLQNPDTATDQKIKEINEAYNVLSDVFLKEQYDAELQKEKQQNQYANKYQENDYSQLYREKEKLKYQLAHEKYEKEEIRKQKNQEDQEVANDSSIGMIKLVKLIFSNRPRFKKIKDLNSQDIIALVLTAVIMITLGIALYFIPFTHDWMYKNFIDTPIINFFR